MASISELADHAQMPVAPRLVQHTADVVALDGWELDQDNPFGLQGAKPKRIFICPNPPPHAFLFGGHRYLFKEPPGWRAPQIWSEVIAYELSRDLGLPVPPAFLATGPGNGSPGVLIEFFYSHPGDEKFRYVDAIELLQGRGFGINFKHGSLKDNIALSRVLGVLNWKDWWCRVVAMDALIGNVDRHSQNWGMLVRSPVEGRLVEYSMAPAFDNGTSLGYGFPDESLPAKSAPHEIAKLVANGCHHFSWTGGAEGARHAALCGDLRTLLRGGIGTSMDDVVNLGDHRIEAIVDWCTRFNFPVPFSGARAHFVAEQLKARRDAIAAELRK